MLPQFNAFAAVGINFDEDPSARVSAGQSVPVNVSAHVWRPLDFFFRGDVKNGGSDCSPTIRSTLPVRCWLPSFLPVSAAVPVPPAPCNRTASAIRKD